MLFDTLLGTIVQWFLSHFVPDLHFKKISPSFSGSVMYIPHPTSHNPRAPISLGLLHILQLKFIHFVKISHYFEMNCNNLRKRQQGMYFFPCLPIQLMRSILNSHSKCINNKSQQMCFLWLYDLKSSQLMAATDFSAFFYGRQGNWS